MEFSKLRILYRLACYKLSAFTKQYSSLMQIVFHNLIARLKNIKDILNLILVVQTKS